MTIAEFYEVTGGNYDEVMARMRTEERVKKFVLMFLKDDSFRLLEDSLAGKNVDEAFRAAHTLKGVGQNLSFERFYKIDFEITEMLRAKDMDAAIAAMPKLRECYQNIVDCIAKLD